MIEIIAKELSKEKKEESCQSTPICDIKNEIKKLMQSKDLEEEKLKAKVELNIFSNLKYFELVSSAFSCVAVLLSWLMLSSSNNNANNNVYNVCHLVLLILISVIVIFLCVIILNHSTKAYKIMYNKLKIESIDELIEKENNNNSITKEKKEDIPKSEDIASNTFIVTVNEIH